MRAIYSIWVSEDEKTFENLLPCSYIPRILLTHSTMLSHPPLPSRFSATTMLETTGHDCFMKPFSTSRHEDIFCGIVPPLKEKTCCT
jgi:hypothetical protein